MTIMSDVCMHMDCVCAYGVVCIHTGGGGGGGGGGCIWSDVFVCIIWLVRSFLIFLWRCYFLSGHRLILCGPGGPNIRGSDYRTTPEHLVIINTRATSLAYN